VGAAGREADRRAAMDWVAILEGEKGRKERKRGRREGGKELKVNKDKDLDRTQVAFFRLCSTGLRGGKIF